MSQQYVDYVALQLVKSEIDNSLLQAQLALTSYLDDSQNFYMLTEAKDGLKQVEGILNLLHISGGQQLAQANNALLADIITHQHTAIAPITLLTEGLMLLSRYLEFVALHQTLWPQAVLTCINQINAYLKHPMLHDGAFIEPLIQSNHLTMLPTLIAPIHLEQQSPDATATQLNLLFKLALSRLLQHNANVPDKLALSWVLNTIAQSAATIHQRHIGIA